MMTLDLVESQKGEDEERRKTSLWCLYELIDFGETEVSFSPDTLMMELFYLDNYKNLPAVLSQ